MTRRGSHTGSTKHNDDGVVLEFNLSILMLDSEIVKSYEAAIE